MDEAKKASEKFGHRGIVGCRYWGKQNIEWIEKIDPKDYLPEAGFVRRLCHDINAKISKYIYVRDQVKLIRTPDDNQDGRYFLVKDIKKVIFN